MALLEVNNLSVMVRTHRGVAAAGRERGTQHVAVTACQVHAGVVHQRGLVQ